MDDFFPALGIFFAGFLLGALFVMVGIPDYKKEAVERGAAHYDTVTGEWMWNNPKEDK